MTSIQNRPSTVEWKPEVTISDGDSLQIDDAAISFQRTIRVPDNQQVSLLPPSCGTFPLKYVKDYASNMSEVMVQKGGLFLPMYSRCFAMSL
jgi:hypothetical protein